MTLPVSPLNLDERRLYPLHEEDDVPETIPHERVVHYLRGAIGAFDPRWLVTGNVCIYWEPDNFADYAAPDLFVAREPPVDPAPRVYQIWRDPPLLFVAEVGSRSTLQEEEEGRLTRYQTLVRAPEHLFVDREKGTLTLRRLGPLGYEIVTPGPLVSRDTGNLEAMFYLSDPLHSLV